MRRGAYARIRKTGVIRRIMKKITVLFGNYGSGKTELALNIANRLRKTQKKVALVDLDIVNPYFRSSEQKGMLEEKGIKVIAPVYANTAVDLPTLPPDIYSVFLGGHAVFDCGGDTVGATALGNLKEHFDKVRGQTQFLYVVNTKRPFQQSAQSIIQNLENIQNSARTCADGFVLNSNLGKETTGKELVSGYEIMKEVAKAAGIPIIFVSGTRQALGIFKERRLDYDGEYLCIDIFMRPYWM